MSSASALYPVVPPQSAFAPSAPCVGVKDGMYHGHTIVKLDTGDRYVVYEHNKHAGQLVAMRHEGWQTLRSVQSVISAVCGVFAGVITKALVTALSATPVGWAVLAGLGVAAAVTAIALAIIWTCNDTDPQAKYEERQNQIIHSKIVGSSSLTTPQEKRKMFFTKSYVDVQKFMEDFRSIVGKGILSPQEEQDVMTGFSRIEGDDRRLEAAKNEALAVIRQAHAHEVTAADRAYDQSPAVAAHAAASLAMCVTSGVDSALGTKLVVGGAYVGAAAWKQEVARERDMRIAQAGMRAELEARSALDTMGYSQQKSAIGSRTSAALQVFRQAHSLSDLMASESTLSPDDTAKVLATL